MMNYHFEKVKIDDRTFKISATNLTVKINFKEAIQLLKKSEIFRNELTSLLRDIPFEGFYWEVKPISVDTLTDAFEFVVVNGHMFVSMTADQNAFAEHFDNDKEVVSFPNLSGDAQLIIPTNKYKATNYAHLAGFLRTGNEIQINDFWIEIAINYEKLINENNLWLSTAGLGVHWLHVRFDKRPKYYRHTPYK